MLTIAGIDSSKVRLGGTYLYADFFLHVPQENQNASIIYGLLTFYELGA